MAKAQSYIKDIRAQVRADHGGKVPEHLNLTIRNYANALELRDKYRETIMKDGVTKTELGSTGQIVTKQHPLCGLLYLQDQIALGNWRITAGGRYDWYEDESWTQSCNGSGVCAQRSATTTLKNEAFSGNLGVLYTFENGFSPYVSYAESFEPSPRSSLDSAAYR